MVAKKYGNLFELPERLPDEEIVDALVSDRDVVIERIVSCGHVTPKDTWYDQDGDEWVALLQGEATLSYEDGERIDLSSGDFLLIPAHTRHRVERTSTHPPCVWIAVHGQLL